MFHILNLTTKELECGANDEPLLFQTGAEARSYCQENPHLRLQPRKLGTDANWREREKKRFANLEYNLPDYIQPYALPDHFLHVSKDKSGMLAYTPDEISGGADIKKRISIRGYLETFHKEKSLKDREALIVKHVETYKFADGLKIATSSEEMVKVYTHYSPNSHQLSSSCMRYPFEDLPFHPVHAYSAGDLAVAYLTDSKGYTTHRSVIWPAKKLYGRCYGDTNALIGLLKKRDYKPGRYFSTDNTSFRGAKLLAVPVPENPGVYLMPYIDEKPMGAYLFDVEDPPYFVLDNEPNGKKKAFVVHHPHGATGPIKKRFRCANCLGAAVETGYVYTNRADITSVRWCLACVEAQSYRCEQSGQRFSIREIPQVEMVDGQIWSEFCFNTVGFQCAIDRKNYHDKSMSVRVYDSEDLWKRVHPHNLKENAWKSTNGRFYFNSVQEVKVKTHDNRTVTWPLQEAKRRAKQVGDGWYLPAPSEQQIPSIANTIKYNPDGSIVVVKRRE